MERYEAFNNFYGEGYEDTLPRELVEAYDIIECLSCTDGCDTLLLKQKSTGKKMVAKCYTGDSTLLDQAEDAKQEDIRCTALPYFVGEYRNETYRCILRNGRLCAAGAVRIYADGYPFGHLFLRGSVVMTFDRKRTAHKASSYKAGKDCGKMLRLCTEQAVQK